MSGVPPIHLKPNAEKATARPLTRVLLRFRAYLMVALTGVLPLIFLLSIVAFTGLTLLHSHQMVMELNFNANFGWRDFRLVVFILLEATSSVLLVRQVIAPSLHGDSWQEMLPGDQPEFFKVIRMIADKVGAPAPAKIVMDSTASLRAEYPDLWSLLRYKGLRLRMGLALPVGLTGAELVAMLAHELAFYGTGTGVISGQFVRGVHRWFYLRIRFDPWLDKLDKCSTSGPIHLRWIWRLLWCVVWLSLRPLRMLYAVCRILSGTTLRIMVQHADECASMVAGHTALAEAIIKRASTERAWADANDRIKQAHGGDRLPDNIPLLVARNLMQEDANFTLESLEKTRTHWLDMAPTDAERIRYIMRWKHEGLVEATGEGTDSFRNFHELARRITFFHYQNDIGKTVSQHMLVPVEETVHEQRSSMETVQVLNRYFRGLAHPERAFCGIAEEQTSLRDPDLLRIELIDCREWLDTYCERMASALDEWARTWQLVRDLEMGLTLSRAGMPVARGQFAMALATPEAFREEIERHRGIMDNLEGLLRQYEGRLETRLACALELLWRAELKDLPPKLADIRETLPHWVLVYEALGLHLPVLREVMTHFHAFQALGASVAGTVDSSSYVSTVQSEIPRILRLVKEIVTTLSQWPYPFQTNFGPEPISLAAFVAPLACEPGALNVEDLEKGSTADRRAAAQRASKHVVQMVTPMMDRYLNLYHQAFAWVTKAADMAEWHFVDPFDPDTKLADLQDRQRAVRTVVEPPPPPHAIIDPELEHAHEHGAAAA